MKSATNKQGRRHEKLADDGNGQKHEWMKKLYTHIYELYCTEISTDRK